MVDGNYSVSRDLVWPRVDTVVYLDYTFGLVLLRLTRRILRRGFSREELWNGNVEPTWQHFFTKDSLIYYLVRSHWRHRRRFVDLIGDPAYGHVSFVRLHSPQAARNWLTAISLAD